MHKAVNSKQVSTYSNTLRWSLSITKKAILIGRSEGCRLQNIPTKNLHFLQSELGQPQVLLVDFKRVFNHKLIFTALAILGHILQHFLTYFRIDEKIETCLHSENRFLWQHFNKFFSKAFIFSICKTQICIPNKFSFDNEVSEQDDKTLYCRSFSTRTYKEVWACTKANYSVRNTVSV